MGTPSALYFRFTVLWNVDFAEMTQDSILFNKICEVPFDILLLGECFLESALKVQRGLLLSVKTYHDKADIFLPTCLFCH